MNNIKIFLSILIITVFAYACKSIDKIVKNPFPVVNKNVTQTAKAPRQFTADADDIGFAKGIDNKGIPLDKTSTFSTQDFQVVAYTTLRNVLGNHSIRWDWHKPNRECYYTSGNHNLINVKKGYYVESIPVSHKISIKGKPPANDPGKWNVKFYYDNKLVKTGGFEIKESPSKNSNLLKAYVWPFEKPDNWENKMVNLADQYMKDFRGRLVRKKCLKILEGPEIEKLRLHKKQEKIIKIDDISTEDLKSLKEYNANSVIVGEIYDDKEGKVTIRIRLLLFNREISYENYVEIETKKFDETEICRQKMEELAEKLCNNVQ